MLFWHLNQFLWLPASLCTHLNRFSRTCAVLLVAEDTGNKTCKPQDILTSSLSHYHFPTLSHCHCVFSYAYKSLRILAKGADACVRSDGERLAKSGESLAGLPCCALLCCGPACQCRQSASLASDTAGSTGRSGRDNATLVSSPNCQIMSPKDTRRYSKEKLSPALFCKLSPRKPAGSQELGAVKFARGGAARLVTISAGRPEAASSTPSQPGHTFHYHALSTDVWSAEEEKNRKGRGWKYFEKENIWAAGREAASSAARTHLSLSCTINNQFLLRCHRHFLCLIHFEHN